MGEPRQDLSKTSFVKTFVLPGLLIFLVPVLSVFFFIHAQSRYDAEVLKAVLKDINSDATLSPEQRAEATAFFQTHPYSELITDPEFAANIESGARFDYATFRWMICLSKYSIVGGVAVFALACVCVLFSRKSQQAQYLSLTVGWQVLRIYGALQAVIQGVLIVALSYWVTALWFQVYIVKLIAVAAILALLGIAAVITGIFKRIKFDSKVEGKVITRAEAPQLWQQLNSICAKVGTDPPDQVVAGIDDNFFVTEMPVEVGGVQYTGRTLYVSLSLLKQMHGTEADAVLAHEMAHFSGNDTAYSCRIAPVLERFGIYLQSLYDNPVTRPVFYFMNCFRALFELSLSEQRREREFRADQIASETTSPRDFASALLRTSAYSDFRGSIQKALFKQERALEMANISVQLEQGFHQYALSFAAKPDIGEMETSHPFDNHPPLAQRCEAIGVVLKSGDVQSLVSASGDGRWYARIDGADQLEQQQWSEFEQRFRNIHEESLAYRFIPENDEERAIVAKAFPELTIPGKKGSLVLNCEWMQYSELPDKVYYGLIIKLTLNDNGTLEIVYNPGAKLKKKIPMKTFGKGQQEAMQAINRYYGRYMAAVAYQKEKQATAGAISS